MSQKDFIAGGASAKAVEMLEGLDRREERIVI